MASGYLLAYSHTTRIYLFPEQLQGSGPIMSIAIHLNGTSIMGSGTKEECVPLYGLAFW